MADYKLIDFIYRLQSSLTLQEAIYGANDPVENPSFELPLEQALRSLNVQLIQEERPLRYQILFEERIICGLFPHNLEGLWWLLINLTHLTTIPCTTVFAKDLVRELGANILIVDEKLPEWYNVCNKMEIL
jgi:hypothetical protein